jgi:1,2-diacylglycerol 3-alpha-glucosyltransferase
MKIGFFSEVYLPKTDGVVYSIETFRHELERRGHEVYIFAPAPSLRYKEKNPRIIRFPAIKGLWFEDYMTKFPWTPQNYRKAKNLKLDLIHVHTPSEIGLFGMSLALKENIPLVTTYHTDLFEYVKHYPQVLPGVLLLTQLLPLLIGQRQLYRESFPMMRPEKSVDNWNQKIVQHMIPLLNNLCDHVIAPSEKTKKQMLAWKTTSPMSVIPTGVDKLTTNEREIKAYYHKFGLSPADKIVLFVGRLGAEKNIELLLQAFAGVYDRVPEAKLVIVGDNPYRPELEKLAHSLGIAQQVRFTSYIKHDKLGAAYATATAFAFPSLTDTQGLVIHEAAASGIPAVLIDRGITEVVVDDVSGFYAKNNHKDMASKLVRLLTDNALRQRLSVGAITHAANFTAAKQTDKLEHLYKELVRAPRPVRKTGE